MSENGNNNERILIEKAMAGDAAAFDTLVKDGFNRVYYVAYAWTADDGAAEDIAQETFVRALLSLHHLQNPDAFVSWLYTIARNLAKARHREKNRESRVLEKLISGYVAMDSFQSRSEGEKTPRGAAMQNEGILRLRTALQRIDPELREILLLHYAEELSQVEIARQLQIPSYTVCRRLETAYGQLRTLLNSDRLPNLGCLKPDGAALSKTLALTGTVAGMSATAKASLLSALGEIGMESAAISVATGTGLGAEQAAHSGYGVSINEPVISGGGKSIMGKFFATGFGKAVTAAVCAGAVIVGGNSIAKKYSVDNSAAVIASAEKNDPDSARRIGAGANRRGGSGGGNSAATTGSQSRTRGTGSLKNSPALSNNDNTLTCPMVMLSGKVTFEGGRAADTAAVELWQNGETFMGEKVSERLMARQTVGSDGSYRVSAPDGTGIRLELKNAARAIADVKVSDAPTSAPTVRLVTQDFVIPAMHTVKGKVVWDDSGQAVAGAKVSLRTRDTITDGWHYGNEIVMSNEAGGFEIPNVATGKSDVGAIAEGCSPVVREIDVPAIPEGEDVVLRLKKATGTIAGELRLMPDEIPVADAMITVRSPSVQSKLGLRKPLVITTDMNGSFRVENVGDEALVLAAKEKSGEALYNATKFSEYWELTGENDTITPALLNATTGYAVKGRITDRDTGKGIEGVKVSNFEYGNNVSKRETVTDKDGYYILHRIRNNNSQVNIVGEKNGWTMFEKIGSVMVTEYDGKIISYAWADFKALPEETLLDFQMARAVTVSGAVKNKLGIGIPNAVVKAVDKVNEIIAQSKSDRNGKFEVSIASFADAYIIVTADGYSRYSKLDLNLSNESLALGDITLADETIIRGTVTTVDGSAIKGQSSTLCVYPGDSEIVRGYVQTKREIPLTSQKLELNSSSQYEWRGVEPGDYVMTLSNQDYETTLSRRFTIHSGETIDNVNLTIKEKSKVQIFGSLTYEDGSRIGKSISIVVQSSEKYHYGISNPKDGAFKITGFKKHVPYKLEYGLNSSDRRTTEVILKDDNNFIKLTIPNKVEQDYILAFWDKDTSKPVTGIDLKTPHVAISGEGLESNEIMCSLEKKTVSIEVKGDDYPWQVISVSPHKIESGDKININLSKGYKFVGRIIDEETGEALPYIPLSFSGSSDSDLYLGSSTDSQGRFDVTLSPNEGSPLYLKISPSELYASRTVRSNLVMEKTSSNWGDIKIGRKTPVTLKIVDFNDKIIPGAFLNLTKSPVGDKPYYEVNFEKNSTNEEGLASFATGSGDVYLTLDSRNKFVIKKLINISKEKKDNNEIQTVRLGTVEGRISLTGSIEKSKVYSIRFTHSDGSFVSLRFENQKNLIAPLQPGQWKVNFITIETTPDGGGKRGKSFSETITVPDTPVFEKQFVIP